MTRRCVRLRVAPAVPPPRRSSNVSPRPAPGEAARSRVMGYIEDFLFGVFPYIYMVVFFLGSWARFDRSQYTWRAQSSQLLRRKQLVWGRILFHVGILRLFFGHFFRLLHPPKNHHPSGFRLQ